MENNLLKNVACAGGWHFRLQSVMRLVQQAAVSGNRNPARVWIVPHEVDPPSNSRHFLTADSNLLSRRLDEDSVEWEKRLKEVGGGAVSAVSLRARVATDQGENTVGYCHAEWAIAKEEFEDLEFALGRELIDARVDQMRELLYLTLDRERDRLCDIHSPELQIANFSELFERVSASLALALSDLQLGAFALDLQAWRQQRRSGTGAVPRAHWYQCDWLPLEKREKIAQELVRQVASPSEGFEQPIESGANLFTLKATHPIAALFDAQQNGSRIFVVAVALFKPQSVKQYSFPFACFVVPCPAGRGLTSLEQEVMRRYLKAFSQVVRLQNITEYTQAEEKLVQKLPYSDSPKVLAQQVVQFLETRFAATEVAVLERQGNYLTILEQRGVPVESVPRLYVHTKEPALVCRVAKENRQNYSDDVSVDGEYLPVVPDTQSQFTMPLIWRGQNVGVLLIGLGVPYGLSAHDQGSILAIASQCGESIAAIQQIAERRAILHTLKDNLPISLSNIDWVLNSANSEPYRRKLEIAANLLRQSLQFVREYARAEQSSPKAINLSEVIDKLLSSELFGERRASGEIRLEHPSEPIIVHANEELLLLAARQVVSNALDAVANPSKSSRRRSKPGSVRVSFDRETEPIPAGVIVVKDEGPGVPIDDQDRIFEFGFTTKETDKHLGGGLSIAKRALESFGGQIEFESQEGHGATFFLSIPEKAPE
jgi:signal transduction histidine kinase